ncbi:MAG: Sec-independent protein translocase protein TatA [Chloroflexi bacterium]|nr:Sec-independent protein translocase protein TatA [Chloroflexota bacterium]
MASFGVWEWVIILIIVLLIFGASRLTDIGKGLGGAINEFKNALDVGKDEADSPEDEEQNP